MNREIKFRGWDKEQSRMLTHDEIDDMDKGGVSHWMDIIKPNNKEGIDVMQYTGLKDRNGKEIYEGDVVSVFNSRSEVVYLNGAFGYKLKGEEHTIISFQSNGYFEWVNSRSNKIEVIGNIYENPDLLNSIQNDERSVATEVK